jgi:peptide/nickel transport system substrate-binding protein
MALEKGDIDMVWNYSSGVGANYQDSLRSSENVKLTSVAATNAPAVLAFNNTKGPFANEDLRKAVAFALDYEQLRSKVGSVDAQTPNRGFVPTSTIGYKDTEALKTDLAEAEKYMNAAGYTKNADGKFVDANGKVFGFTLTFRSDRNNHVSCADIIKNCLESFGIEVKLEPLDSASYNAKTSNKFSENNITMEAALFGYTSAGMSMGAGLGTIYVDGTHAVQGGCQVFDETFKAAVDELGSAATLEEYGKAAAKVQDYYAEHMPLVGLYWDSLTYGSSAKIDNMTIDNVFGLNNANNWLSITVK